MSEVKELIREINKANKRSRIVGHILTAVVIILIGVAFYTTKISLDAKHDAEHATELVEQGKIRAEAIAADLKISQENLQGEKDKLEQIQVSYDSLRQSIIQEQQNLWNYTTEQNTLEGYSDYLSIKGEDDHDVVDKIRPFLKSTGYVQIQDSNGEMLFDPLNNEEGDLWKPKSARSIRNGVVGKADQKTIARNGDVILEGQIIQIVDDSLMSGKSRWAKIKY